MKHKASEFWNEMWERMDEPIRGSDDLLKAQVEGLTPGRALEIGCGTGGNAVWLAEHGWKVTAIDFSNVAIEKGKKLAKERGVSVDFVVADAAAYQPEGEFDLVTSFYIHLQPEQRAKMLTIASDALAPGGTLLFVSHDKTSPPSAWSEDDMDTLTTPEQVVSELPYLKIEQAYVLKEESGAHAQRHGSNEPPEPHDHHDQREHYDFHKAFGAEPDYSYESSSTIVRAVRPA